MITVATSVITSSETGLRPLSRRSVSDSICLSSSNFNRLKSLSDKALFCRVLSSRGAMNDKENVIIPIMHVLATWLLRISTDKEREMPRNLVTEWLSMGEKLIIASPHHRSEVQIRGWTRSQPSSLQGLDK
ncbi:hypothetical protein TNCV_2473621 [Trichonephila clavipes]|nr:hypothetical protein TNCV_2473621 [Trichonephila clavipes]